MILSFFVLFILYYIINPPTYSFGFFYHQGGEKNGKKYHIFFIPVPPFLL